MFWKKHSPAPALVEAACGRAPPFPPKRHLWHRSRWWLTGVVATLLVGLGTRMLIDAPPPDLSDLEYQPHSVADEDNFYPAMLEWCAAVAANPLITADLAQRFPPTLRTADEESSSYSDRKTDAERLHDQLSAGQAWTPELQDILHPKLQSTWQDFQQIMRRPSCQAPQIFSYEQAHETPKMRPGWTTLSLAAWDQFYGGNQKKAADILLTAWAGALRIRNSRGDLLDYLSGIVGESIARETITLVAMHPAIHRETIDHLLQGIRQLPLDSDETPDFGADSLRHEYSLTMNTIRTMTPAQLEQYLGFETLCSPNPPLIIRKLARFGFPFVYQPNRTQAMGATHMRLILQNMASVPPRLEDMKKQERHTHFEEEFPSPWWDFRNWAGPLILTKAMPSVENIPKNRLLSRSRNSIAISTLALRLYYFEHEKLPKSLAELVPDYLPDVPLDFIDRQPIRYSKDFLAVWTIGEKNLQVNQIGQKAKAREFIQHLEFVPLSANAPSASTPEPPSTGGNT